MTQISTIAQTIIQQIHSLDRWFFAGNLHKGDAPLSTETGVRFKIRRAGVFSIAIDYDAGSDLYNVSAQRRGRSNLDWHEAKTTEGVFADSLIEAIDLVTDRARAD